jgi:thiol-disulfide isomerase/thioredoxin
MNRDNISALIMAIAVVSLITGFAVYFNSPYLNKAASSEQQESNFIPASIENKNGSIISQLDKSQFKKAPDFAKITGYINTEEGRPINLKDLKGKVVLVDFWTYSCINCIRTLPYLVDWNEKYADKGLVIVGVHSPEFEFEKNVDNVKAAVQKYGIKYPVIQDNDKGTWDAYQNRYWPRKYLVDNEGYIRYDHIGEGGYAETEKVIRSLLAERAAQTGISAINLDTNTNTTTTPKNVQTVDFTKVKTPELFFGYEFARAPLGNSEGFRPNQTVTYSIPQRSDLKPNTIYLIGDWKNNADNMELQSDTGRIALAYSAKSVNVVAGGKGEGGEELSISENGVALTNKSGRGIDLSEQGKLVVDGQRLYNIVMHEGYDWRSLIIDVKGKGFQIYTLTFG